MILILTIHRIELKMNKDIHGYYVVNNQKFYSKVQALVYASKLLDKINEKINDRNIKIKDPTMLVKWNFNDEVFEKYDWTKEPEIDLETLYFKRAKELREKYDYIIVYYSGGVDSHNLVMSFLNNNLFIDEIVVHHVNDGIKILSNSHLSPLDAKIQPLTETNLQVIPRLTEIKQLSPKTKIKMMDTTQHTIDTFSKNQSGEWVMNVREELNPIDSAKYNFTCFDEYKKTIELNKKVGILVGLDKPCLKIKYDEVYLCFHDRRFNVNLFYNEIEKYSNAQVEFFYTSPDTCALMCKQAHELKKWLSTSRQNVMMLQENIAPINDKMKALIATKNRIARLFLEENSRTILFSKTWKKDWFQAKKSTLDWHSEADFWFHERFDSTSMPGSCWRNGVEYIRDNIDEIFLIKFDRAEIDYSLFNEYSPSHKPMDYDGFYEFTKKYSLGKISNSNLLLS
jgi:hypothetical protein